MIYLDDQADGLLAFSALGPKPKVSAVPGAFAQAFGLALAPKKALLVAEAGAHRIVWLKLTGGARIAVDAAGAAGGPFVAPRGVALLPDGRLVVADTGMHRLMTSRFTVADLAAGRASPTEWDAFGQPGNLPAAAAGTFKAPQSVHVDALGRIVVSDPALQRLVRIDAPDGTGWTEIALPDAPLPPQPYGIAAGPNGGLLVTDLVNSRVIFIAADDTAKVLVDGTAGRTVIAPVAAVMMGRSIVVADAAAAQLSEWARTTKGTWKLRRRLLGHPGPLGGPRFTRVVALTSTSTAIVMAGGGPL